MKGIFRTREISRDVVKVCAFPAVEEDLVELKKKYESNGYSVEYLVFDSWNAEIEAFFMDGEYRRTDNLVYCFDHFQDFISDKFGINVSVIF